MANKLMVAVACLRWLIAFPAKLEVLGLATALFVILLLATPPVAAPESCLSLRSARARWPTAHLYWHGRGHCWDAHRHARAALLAKSSHPKTITHARPRPVRLDVKEVQPGDFNDIDAASFAPWRSRIEDQPFWRAVIK